MLKLNCWQQFQQYSLTVNFRLQAQADSVHTKREKEKFAHYLKAVSKGLVGERPTDSNLPSGHKLIDVPEDSIMDLTRYGTGHWSDTEPATPLIDWVYASPPPVADSHSQSYYDWYAQRAVLCLHRETVAQSNMYAMSTIGQSNTFISEAVNTLVERTVDGRHPAIPGIGTKLHRLCELVGELLGCSLHN